MISWSSLLILSMYDHLNGMTLAPHKRQILSLNIIQFKYFSEITAQAK